MKLYTHVCEYVIVFIVIITCCIENYFLGDSITNCDFNFFVLVWLRSFSLPHLVPSAG
jgi:hypothetical protein